MLDRSDFEFADLEHRHVSIFLILTPYRLSTDSRPISLVIAQSLLDVARDAAKPDAPVLYLLG